MYMCVYEATQHYIIQNISVLTYLIYFVIYNVRCVVQRG